MNNPRPALCRALADTENRGNLQSLLDTLLPRIDTRQRAWVRDLLSGCYRWLPAIDWLLARKLRKPLPAEDQDIRWLLRLATYQIFWGRTGAHHIVNESVDAARRLRKPRLSGLVNGVLRALLREPDALQQAPEAIRLGHPQWLLERLRAQHPEYWPEIVAANNEQGPMCLRVDLSRTDREDYLQQLRRAGIEARPGAITAGAVYLSRPCAVDELPGFDEGLVSVQDEGAQLAAAMLPPADGEAVVDACAAPGGKLVHLLECGWRDVLAIELDARRAERVQQNLARTRRCARLQIADAGEPDSWWDGRPFAAILLDAPCSASGVIRRNPDIKVQRRPEDLAGFAAQQRRLLDALWPLLAEGGRLLYATCSVLDEENDAVIAGFLAAHADARPDTPVIAGTRPARHGIQLLPARQAQDGFYYARLQKLAAGNAAGRRQAQEAAMGTGYTAPTEAAPATGASPDRPCSTNWPETR